MACHLPWSCGGDRRRRACVVHRGGGLDRGQRVRTLGYGFRLPDTPAWALGCTPSDEVSTTVSGLGGVGRCTWELCVSWQTGWWGAWRKVPLRLGLAVPHRLHFKPVSVHQPLFFATFAVGGGWRGCAGCGRGLGHDGDVSWLDCGHVCKVHASCRLLTAQCCLRARC